MILLNRGLIHLETLVLRVVRSVDLLLLLVLGQALGQRYGAAVRFVIFGVEALFLGLCGLILVLGHGTGVFGPRRLLSVVGGFKVCSVQLDLVLIYLSGQLLTSGFDRL